MRIFHFITIILAASCCTALAGGATNRVDAFSKLKPGDVLIVRFHTSGCFYSATHEFTFRRTSELTVSVVQLLGEINRVGLGTLTLSKSDIAGLDRLVGDVYRSKHNTVCTTVEDITFTQQRDGKTVATEEIRDHSGQSYLMNRLTKFPDLIGRLTSQKR